jgi:hypothetical protein
MDGEAVDVVRRDRKKLGLTPPSYLIYNCFISI